MAKRRHDVPATSSSRTTIAILTVGGLLVAALIIWALTRTVEAPATAAVDTAQTTAIPPGSPAVNAPLTTAPTTATQTPITATQTPPAPAAQPPARGDNASVPRIAAEDLREKAKRGDVLIVDVRDANSYALAHIPGAVHIPFSSVEAAAATLPKDKPIVTYCT